MLWVILEITVLLAGLGLNCSWEPVFLNRTVLFVFLGWFWGFLLGSEKCTKQRVECDGIRLSGQC